MRTANSGLMNIAPGEGEDGGGGGVGRPTRRSVDSGRESHVMEPRKTIDGARAVIHANGSTAAPLGPGVEVRPGSESVACAQGSAPEPGRSHRLPVESAGGATGNQKPP